MKKGQIFEWKEVDKITSVDLITRPLLDTTRLKLHFIGFYKEEYYDFWWEYRTKKITKVKKLDRGIFTKLYGIAPIPKKVSKPKEETNKEHTDKIVKGMESALEDVKHGRYTVETSEKPKSKKKPKKIKRRKTIK